MKKDTTKRDGLIMLALLAALLLAVPMWWVVSSAFEAAAFRKLTGRDDVTTWDAMFVQLRVDK